MIKRCFILLGLWMSLIAGAMGQSTFSGTGLWSDPARWSSGVPTSATNAIIANNASCTVDMAAEAASLSIAGGANNTTLAISGSNSLAVGGGITINAPTANNISKIIDAGSGTLTAASMTMATTTANSRDCILSISTGSVSIAGNIAMNGIFARNHIDWSGNGALVVGGNMTGGGLTMGANGAVEYAGAGAQTAGGAYTYNNMSVTGGGTVSIGGNTTVNGNLTVASGTLVFGAFTTSVADTTSISGTLQITSATGTKTFVGPVVINSGGTWENTANEAVVFQGGLTHDGASFISGTGAQIFNTNSQSIAGSSPLSFSGIVAIVGAITITNQHSAGIDIIGNLTGSIAGSTWLNASGSTLSAGAAVLVTGALTATADPNTVIYNGGGAQTVKTATYHNLIINKSGGTATMTNSTVNNNFEVLSGTAAIGNVAFTVLDTTVIAATLNITNAGGAKSFGGVVTIQPGGVWNNSSNSPITFQGGLMHDGTTFTSGSGIQTFNTNPQQVGGTVPITIQNLTVTGVTLTNTGTLTVTTSLAGTGTMANAALQVLNINFTGTPAITGLDATASGNTVSYGAGGAQTMRATDYYHLALATSGVKTFESGTTTLAGMLTLGGIVTTDATTNSSMVAYVGTSAQSITSMTYFDLTISNAGTKTATGSITVANNFNNSTLCDMVTETLSIGGTRSNSGTIFFAGETNGLSFDSGIVEYNGTSAQAPAGQTIALGIYNNLLISNDAAKRITGGLVHTLSGLTVGSVVTLNVASDGALQVDGDLTNDGTLTNDGLITVGN